MNDRLIVLLVVVFLGVGFLGCLGGGFYLAAQGVEVPDYLIGLGGTALGALGALLSRTGTTQPQPVEVVNSRSDAVPVDAT